MCQGTYPKLRYHNHNYALYMYCASVHAGTCMHNCMGIYTHSALYSCVRYYFIQHPQHSPRTSSSRARVFAHVHNERMNCVLPCMLELLNDGQLCRVVRVPQCCQRVIDAARSLVRMPCCQWPAHTAATVVTAGRRRVPPSRMADMSGCH